jgi:hypothetical protein
MMAAMIINATAANHCRRLMLFEISQPDDREYHGVDHHQPSYDAVALLLFREVDLVLVLLYHSVYLLYQLLPFLRPTLLHSNTTINRLVITTPAST